MSQVTTAQPTSPTRPTGRIVARWMVSFVGFPLGGLVALVLSGPVNSAGNRCGRRTLTGAVLGAAQAWALRFDRRQLADVDPRDRRRPCRAASRSAPRSSLPHRHRRPGPAGRRHRASVGLAQALVLRRRTGPVAFVWPAYLAVAWAIGLGGHHGRRHRRRGAVHHLWCVRRRHRHPAHRRPPPSCHPPRSHREEQLMNRHVVFGTGQVGHPLVEQLVARGHDVVAVNRDGRGPFPGA